MSFKEVSPCIVVSSLGKTLILNLVPSLCVLPFLLFLALKICWSFTHSHSPLQYLHSLSDMEIRIPFLIDSVVLQFWVDTALSREEVWKCVYQDHRHALRIATRLRRPFSLLEHRHTRWAPLWTCSRAPASAKKCNCEPITHAPKSKYKEKGIPLCSGRGSYAALPLPEYSCGGRSWLAAVADRETFFSWVLWLQIESRQQPIISFYIANVMEVLNDKLIKSCLVAKRSKHWNKKSIVLCQMAV